MPNQVQYMFLVIVSTGASYGKDVKQISEILPDDLEIIRYSADFDAKSSQWTPKYFNADGEETSFPPNENYTHALLEELRERGWRQIGEPSTNRVNIHEITLLHPGGQAYRILETYTFTKSEG